MRNTIFTVIFLALTGCSNVVAPTDDGGLAEDASVDVDAGTSALGNPITPYQACAWMHQYAENVESACGDAYACPWDDTNVTDYVCDKDVLLPCLQTAAADETCTSFWDVLENDPACASVCP